MLVQIDGKHDDADSLWWPAMNFNQFRWDYPLGSYELLIPRNELIFRLKASYQKCVDELRVDDILCPDERPAPMGEIGYPPLEILMEHPAEFTDAIQCYLWDHLLEAFIPWPPKNPKFMINSIDRASVLPTDVVIRGRGYFVGSKSSPTIDPAGGAVP